MQTDITAKNEADIADVRSTGTPKEEIADKEVSAGNAESSDRFADDAYGDIADDIFPDDDVGPGEKTEKIPFGSRLASLFKKPGRKNLIIAASVLLLGCAVFLNYILFSDGDSGSGDYLDYSSGLIDGEGASAAGGNENDAVSAGDDGAADQDALSASDSYFAEATINRQRARDEALEVLAMVVENDEALQELKDDALRDISRIASEIEAEAAIESLVISKGFADCVAVVNESSASVIVSSDGLLPNEIAQIQEIVSTQAGIAPTSLTIIEKTP